MQHPQKRFYRVILLSILYCVCIISILLAFPKNVWYTDNALDGVYMWSAKSAWVKLPVQVEWWQGKKTQTITPQPTPITTTRVIPIKTTVVPKKKTILTCSEVWMCDKVHFGDWYTDKQRTLYYTAILEVVSSIQNALPKTTRISDVLFSVSLSNTIWDRRWWGWSKTIVINTKDISNTQEFREILTHELWHIIDLWVNAGVSLQLDQSFTLWWVAKFWVDDRSLDFYRISRDNTDTRKADATYVDFVWGYAMSNPYEDFAESFNMYIWHNDTFRAMTSWSEKLQKKYNFIQSIIWSLILGTDWKNVTTVNANAKRRPWDSTRMSLE